MKKIKILVDGRLISDKPTGISRYSREIIKSYEKQYGNACVYVLCNEENAAGYDRKIVTKYKPYNLLHFLLLYIKIRKLNFDVYHATFYSGVPFKIKKTFVVVTVHDLMFYKVPLFFSANKFVNDVARLYYNIIVKSTLRIADLVVSVSGTTAADVEETYSRKSLVIAEGVETNKEVSDETYVKSILEMYNLNFKEYLLYVGNNRRHKNISFLKNAFLNSKSRLKLLLVGFKDEDIEDERIYNITYVDDKVLHALYKGCIAFVYPSVYEGFGLPVLEAIANRTMVFSSFQGALREFNFKSVHYFDPYNSSELEGLIDNCESFQFVETDFDLLQTEYNWKKNFGVFQKKLYSILLEKQIL